eukprot:m51a1_g7646 hypothetical protein (411) ;mRNA; f:374574-375996
MDQPMSSETSSCRAVYRLCGNEAVHNQHNFCQIIAWALLEGSGVKDLTRDRLSHALSAVARRHPLLRGRREPQRFWKVAVDDDDVQLPATLQRCGSRDDAWNEFQKQVKEVYWESERMLQVDAYVFPGPNNEPLAGLIMHGNHAVADGFALQLALRDLACALDGAALLPQPMPRPFFERFPELHLSAAEPPAEPQAQGAHSSEPAHAAKSHGATVTTLLMAAGSLASERSDIDFIVVVNLRPPSASDEVSFAVTLLPFERTALPPQPASSAKLWQVAREFTGVLQSKLAAHEQYRTRLAGEEYRNAVLAVCDAPTESLYHEGRPAFMSMSSMGVVDGHVALPGDVGARWAITEFVPCCCNYTTASMPNLFCCTLCGRLNVTCTSTNPPVDPHQFSRFFQRFVSLLLTLDD